MSLGTGRWRQVESILDQALELPADQRVALLDRACAGDEGLRRDVERMLEACDLGEGLFEAPGGVEGGLAAAWSEGPREEGGLPGSHRDRLAPGDRLGAYRVLELLGRGGMGAVYLAERADGAFDRRVALKVVKRGMDTDEILDRFRREREILARLQHPHIANLMDGGVTPSGLPFFVLELVEGDPIDVWCDRHRLGLEARLRLFLSVCDAVRYAHGALVVHRDLKPGNILVHDGEVKLLDFGIARLLEDREGGDATRLVDRRLTPEYAAPEQIRGEPTTTSVDVYALGVILYELLTGERPHRLEGSFAEIERAVSEVEPRSPSTVALQEGEPHGSPPVARAEARGVTPRLLRERLRGDLDCIVLRALGKDPSRRYNSVEALAEDIERHLAGRTVRARPDSRWYRVSTFVRRNRTAALLAALAAFGLLGGSVATTIFALVANEERDRRQLEAQRAVAARDFVVGLFAELDPDRLQGQDTFTRDQLIDLGTRNLDDLEAQPALKASVLNTLGQVAFNLGDVGRAEGFFREAYELLSDAPQELEVATSMMGLGEVLRSEHRFPEAEGWFRSALVTQRATLPPDDLRIAEGMLALAFVLYNEGQLDESEPIYQDLLASDARLPLRFRSTVREGLANVRLDQGSHGEAEQFYREAVALREEAVGSLDAAAGRTLWGLGQSLVGLGRLEEAEQVYRQAMDVHREMYGDDHPNVARGFLNVGQVLFWKEDWVGAGAALEEAALRFPVGHPNRAGAQHWLGLAESRRGRLALAESHFRDALEFYLGRSDNPAVIASLRAVLARTLIDRGAFEEAEPFLRDALAWQEAHGNPSSLQNIRRILADWFEATGRPDSAAIYRETRGGPPPDSGDPLGGGLP